MHGQQNIKFLIIAYRKFRKYNNFYKLIVAQSSFHRKWSFILLFIKAYYIILFNHCNTQHALSLRTVYKFTYKFIMPKGSLYRHQMNYAFGKES